MSGGLMGGINSGISLLWKLLVFIFIVFIIVEIIGIFVPGFTLDKIKQITLFNKDNQFVDTQNNATTSTQNATFYSNKVFDFFGFSQIINLTNQRQNSTSTNLFSNHKKLAPTLEDVNIKNKEDYGYGSNYYDFGSSQSQYNQNTFKTLNYQEIINNKSNINTNNNVNLNNYYNQSQNYYDNQNINYYNNN